MSAETPERGSARPADTVVDPGRSYRERLPIGERLTLPDGDVLATWDIFPFETDGLRPKVLDEPVLPEPPRNGETGADDCFACRGDGEVIWSNHNWSVSALRSTGLPAMVLLRPRRHHDLGDLPPDLVAELGPMLVRLEAAVMAVPGTGRVHLNKWGDGGAHLHWFALARPAGLMQLRGSALVMWDDLLPNVPTEMMDRNLAVIADELHRSEP